MFCSIKYNLGYGGNRKAGYRYFIERGFDIAVLLHGDGQYAPEVPAGLYHPLVVDQVEAIMLLKPPGVLAVRSETAISYNRIGCFVPWVCRREGKDTCSNQRTWPFSASDTSGA